MNKLIIQKITTFSDSFNKQYKSLLNAVYLKLKTFINESGNNINTISLRVQKLSHFKGALPVYESSGASGFDIRAQIDNPITITPLERIVVPTGLILEIPEGCELQVRSRSGLSLKTGLCVCNSPGTIDSDYTGELKIILINFSKIDVVIKDQQKIAQVVLCPVFKADLKFTNKDIKSTKRGAGGFGSTGV